MFFRLFRQSPKVSVNTHKLLTVLSASSKVYIEVIPFRLRLPISLGLGLRKIFHINHLFNLKNSCGSVCIQHQ
jgi:hypothetical protein